MRVTKGQLKRIIREEMARLYESENEEGDSDVSSVVSAPAVGTEGEGKVDPAESRMKLALDLKEKIVNTKGLLRGEFEVFLSIIEELLTMFGDKNLSSRDEDDVASAMKQVYLKMRVGRQA